MFVRSTRDAIHPTHCGLVLRFNKTLNKSSITLLLEPRMPPGNSSSDANGLTPRPRASEMFKDGKIFENEGQKQSMIEIEISTKTDLLSVTRGVLISIGIQ